MITVYTKKTSLRYSGPSTVAAAAAATNPTVEYLIVGGGGAGGGSGGGGGGGGGVVSGNIIANTDYQYTITVGAGGAGIAGLGNPGDYSLFNDILAFGGGYGGIYATATLMGNSSTYGFRGSGGGQGVGETRWTAQPSFPGQGNRGGNASTLGVYTGGGGGGAGEAALNATDSASTRGGNGIFSSISGTSVAYAGGGNAAAHTSGKTTPSITAAGGGALGGVTQTATGGTGIARGANGSINSGGGGGGSGYTGLPLGGSGGSGVIILSYSTSFANAASTGSPTYSESSGKRIFTYTGSGTITF